MSAKLTCAYSECQSAGVILPDAPVRFAVTGEGIERFEFWFHPGCWAAEQRRDTEQRRRPA